MANDITSPFYIPEMGHLLNQTQAQFSKSKKTPSMRTYHRLLDDNLILGMGAGLAAQLTGDLNWTHQKQETTFSAPHTKGYKAGLKGQWDIGRLLTQLTILYHQTTNVHFYPRRSISTSVRLGKELKTMTPYLHLHGNFPLNARPDFDNPLYRIEAGVFQHVNEKITLDTTLYLQYDKNVKGKSYGIQGEWAYLFTPWMALSINGNWQARGHAKYGQKTYHKSVGIKTTFTF